jgi:hypothetical protein
MRDLEGETSEEKKYQLFHKQIFKISFQTQRQPEGFSFSQFSKILSMTFFLLEKSLFTAYALTTASLLFSQTTENQILDDNIRSAQLYLNGAPLTLPLVELKTGFNTLILEFDYAGDELKDYVYTLEHCNSDWQRSELNDNEYIDGFTEDRITDIESSFNTLADYTHYKLGLPNSNMRWARSGNYLLKIYDNDDDRKLVLVRRFMVVEPQWAVDAKVVSPAAVSKLNTHHEIDFTVKHKNLRISNPQNDVKAFVLQNGRWDNALGPFTPFVSRAEEEVFDYQDKVVFPAGREWRYFDISTFDYKGDRVRDIRAKYDFYEVTLQTDEDRAGNKLTSKGDINGRFSIENNTPNQTRLQCDYAKVLFSVSKNAPLQDEDVYVFGELTDWKLSPKWKMEYSAEVKAYYVESPLLKQGVYNYEYKVVDRETGETDPDGFEGNWHETSNLYTVLVYYRPFGERYDRLMAAATINSGSKED